MFRRNYYKNKKIIITGHTGFKGSWLAFWLWMQGAKIYGISIDIPSKPSLFNVLGLNKKITNYFFDIREYKLIKKTINKIKPEFLFHLAAQSIVSKSYEDPIYTYTTNIIGTTNILNSFINYKSKCSLIIITSDKCYFNKEWELSYRENDQLGGVDPYSASKASCELIFYSYFKSFYEKHKCVRIVSCRAGNVIGGGDWSNNRIIPDIIKAWFGRSILRIRNPKSIRPWQHVLDPLYGYMLIGQKLHNDKSLNGISLNFGPNNKNNFQVIKVLAEMENNLGKINIKITKSNFGKEAKLLKLNCDKANELLQWNCKLNFKKSLKFTSDWYKNYYQKKDMINITKNQIEEYEILVK